MSALFPSPVTAESASGATPAPHAFAAVLLAGGVLVALMGVCLPRPASAQSPAANVPAQAPAAKTTAPKAAATKGPATSKAKVSNKKKVVEPPPEAEVVVANADDEQLLAAKEVHFGESGCEFGQKIQLDASTMHPGYVDMSFNQKKYVLKPVRSSTGALRLEDVRSEALMIQISSKTMLMDQKTGHRLLDNCVHPDQKVTAADAEQVLMK